MCCAFWPWMSRLRQSTEADEYKHDRRLLENGPNGATRRHTYEDDQSESEYRRWCCLAVIDGMISSVQLIFKVIPSYCGDKTVAEGEGDHGANDSGRSLTSLRQQAASALWSTVRGISSMAWFKLNAASVCLTELHWGTQRRNDEVVHLCSIRSMIKVA